MRGRTVDGTPLAPGVNVDALKPSAGLAEARKIGYNTPKDAMVIDYALWRWARGEEDGAIKTFLSEGIDLTSAYRIIAAARAGAEL